MRCGIPQPARAFQVLRCNSSHNQLPLTPLSRSKIRPKLTWFREGFRSRGSGNTQTAMDSSERKKQTHLRCERQRREAINTGYSDLKDLLPASTSFAGCKTTNASILFRAADYVKSLDEQIKEREKRIAGCGSQQAAMCLIIQQYESMCADRTQPYQTQLLKSLLDQCFESFKDEVDITDYQTLTKTLLLWVENIKYAEIVNNVLTKTE